MNMKGIYIATIFFWVTLTSMGCVDLVSVDICKRASYRSVPSAGFITTSLYPDWAIIGHAACKCTFYHQGRGYRYLKLTEEKFHTLPPSASPQLCPLTVRMTDDVSSVTSPSCPDTRQNHSQVLQYGSKGKVVTLCLENPLMEKVNVTLRISYEASSKRLHLKCGPTSLNDCVKASRRQYDTQSVRKTRLSRQVPSQSSENRNTSVLSKTTPVNQSSLMVPLIMAGIPTELQNSSQLQDIQLLNYTDKNSISNSDSDGKILYSELPVLDNADSFSGDPDTEMGILSLDTVTDMFSVNDTSSQTETPLQDSNTNGTVMLLTESTTYRQPANQNVYTAQYVENMEKGELTTEDPLVIKPWNKTKEVQFEGNVSGRATVMKYTRTAYDGIRKFSYSDIGENVKSSTMAPENYILYENQQHASNGFILSSTLLIKSFDDNFPYKPHATVSSSSQTSNIVDYTLSFLDNFDYFSPATTVISPSNMPQVTASITEETFPEIPSEHFINITSTEMVKKADTTFDSQLLNITSQLISSMPVDIFNSIPDMTESEKNSYTSIEKTQYVPQDSYSVPERGDIRVREEHEQILDMTTNKTWPWIPDDHWPTMEIMETVTMDTMDTVTMGIADAVTMDIVDAVTTDTVDSVTMDIVDTVTTGIMDTVTTKTAEAVSKDTVDTITKDTVDTVTMDIADTVTITNTIQSTEISMSNKTQGELKTAHEAEQMRIAAIILGCIAFVLLVAVVGLVLLVKQNSVSMTSEISDHCEDGIISGTYTAQTVI